MQLQKCGSVAADVRADPESWTESVLTFFPTEKKREGKKGLDSNLEEMPLTVLQAATCMLHARDELPSQFLLSLIIMSQNWCHFYLWY